MAVNDKSRDKLSRMMEDEVTRMFEQILDYSQVACPTSDTYKVLRSKILRVSNNCIRTIKSNMRHYDVEYKAIAEDLIEIAAVKEN